MKKFNVASFFNKFPEIKLGYIDKLGISIKMRDMRLSDGEKYLELYSDPNVSRYLSDEDVPNSLEEATNSVKFWGSLFYYKRSIFWTIADEKTDEMIGNIGLVSYNYTNRRAEISYDLMQKYWRNGIINMALDAAMNIAFNKMNVYRLEARTMIKNEASRGILTKKGFKLEGILRGYRIIREIPEDITMFSLIKPDYEEIQRNKFSANSFE